MGLSKVVEGLERWETRMECNALLAHKIDDVGVILGTTSFSKDVDTIITIATQNGNHLR